MHTKTFISIFIVLILIGAGIGYLVSQSSPDAPVPQNETPMGRETPQPSTASNMATFSDAALGIEFQYPGGADGFHFARIDNNSSDPTFVTLLQMTDMDDYAELMRSTEGREGPPTLDIRVFKNVDRLSPSVWAMRNPLVSNIEFKIGEETEAVVGGANAVRYTNDGLYTTKNVVVAHGGFIYLISAGYMDETSLPLRALEVVLTSVRFIPTEVKG